MLSELLISCSGTRQAAVLLHLTKPHPPERTNNKTFQSAKNTPLSLANADAFEMNSLCVRVGLVAAPPSPHSPQHPRCELQSSPSVHALHFRSAERPFSLHRFRVLCNNLHPGRGNACCPLLVHACLSVHLVKMPVIPNPIRNTKPKSAYGSSINPVCTQTPGSVFNIKRAHLRRFFPTSFLL